MGKVEAVGLGLLLLPLSPLVLVGNVGERISSLLLL
jgi:hypothetical protein